MKYIAHKALFSTRVMFTKKKKKNTTYTFNLHKPSKTLERAVVGVVVMIVVSNHKKIMTAALMK